jgi:hypothetical protein
LFIYNPRDQECGGRNQSHHSKHFACLGGDSEKGILEIEDRKMSSIRRDVGEDCIRIWDQWVDGDNSLIYNV